MGARSRAEPGTALMMRVMFPVVVIFASMVMISSEVALAAEVVPAEEVIQEEYGTPSDISTICGDCKMPKTVVSASALSTRMAATPLATYGHLFGIHRRGGIDYVVDRNLYARQREREREMLAFAHSRIPDGWPKAVEPPGYVTHTQELRQKENAVKAKGVKTEKGAKRAIKRKNENTGKATRKIAAALKRSQEVEAKAVRNAHHVIQQSANKALEKQRKTAELSKKVIAKKKEVGMKGLHNLKEKILREAAKEKKTKVSEMKRKERTQKLLTEKTEKTSAAMKEALQKADSTVRATRKNMKARVGELRAKNTELRKEMGEATKGVDHLTHVATRLRSQIRSARAAQRSHKEGNMKGIATAKNKETAIKKRIKRVTAAGLKKIERMAGRVKVVQQLEAVQRTEKQQQMQLEAKTHEGIKNIQAMTRKLKRMKSGSTATKYAKEVAKAKTQEKAEKKAMSTYMAQQVSAVNHELKQVKALQTSA